MACPTVNCDVTPCYPQICCDNDYQNRIVAAAFVKKGTSLTKTTVSAFLLSLLQAEADGKAIIIRDINGELPMPDQSELVGRGKAQSYPGPRSFVLTADEFRPVKAVQFYNEMTTRVSAYDLYYITPKVLWDASGEALTFNGSPVITKDINTFIQGQFMVKWVSNLIPTTYECFDDDTINLCPVPNIVLASEVIDSLSFTYEQDNNYVTSGLTVESPYDGVTIEQVFDVVLPDDFPETLDVTVTDEGELTIDVPGSVPEGVYSFQLVGSNINGCLAKSITVTITVIPEP